MFPVGQPSTPAPAAPAAPAAAPAPAPAPAYNPPDGVVDGGLPQGTPHPGEMSPTPAQPTGPDANAQVNAATNQLPPGAATPEAAALSTSARAMAAAMGFAGANQFADDRAFLEAVLGQAQAATAAQQQMAAMQNYQAALAQATALAQQQRQQAAQPAPAKQNAIWNPPEYNPAWASLVRTDEKGIPTLVPGAPAEILPKYLAYQQYRQQFADRFLSDPEGTLMPLINSAAVEQAKEVVRREWEQRQTESYIQGFVAENSGWLHARDASGQVVMNPQTNQPALSPAGQRFRDYVVQADRMGVRDVRQQEQYARTSLQRDILAAQQQQAAAQAGTQQQVIEANRRPSAAGMMPQAGVTPPPAAGASLAQQLQLALQAHGVTDANIDA